jgi:hypothetical protein
VSRLQELLKDGDPVVRDASLPAADVERMRRRVVDAEQQRERSFEIGRLPRLAAAMVILAAAAIGVVSWRSPAGRESSEKGPASRGAAMQPVTRQLIFETPGGTRVIWVFNPEFRE